MENVLILSASKWEFTDEKTAEVKKGVSVHYVSDYRDDTATELGFKPIKTSADDAVFEIAQKGGVPGMYRIDTRSRPGKDGKPTLTVVGAQFAKKVPLFEKEKA